MHLSSGGTPIPADRSIDTSSPAGIQPAGESAVAEPEAGL